MKIKWTLSLGHCMVCQSFFATKLLSIPFGLKAIYTQTQSEIFAFPKVQTVAVLSVLNSLFCEVLQPYTLKTCTEAAGTLNFQHRYYLRDNECNIKLNNCL